MSFLLASTTNAPVSDTSVPLYTTLISRMCHFKRQLISDFNISGLGIQHNLRSGINFVVPLVSDLGHNNRRLPVSHMRSAYVRQGNGMSKGTADSSSRERKASDI